jgi:hypothetical protein
LERPGQNLVDRSKRRSSGLLVEEPWQPAFFLFAGCLPGSAFGGGLSSQTMLAYIFLKTFNHFFWGPADVQQTIPQYLFIFCHKVRNEGMAVGILNF